MTSPSTRARLSERVSVPGMLTRTAATPSSARGFTVLEIAIAITLFIAVAAVLSVTLATSTVVNSIQRSERLLQEQAAAGLTQISQGSYDDLLTDNFLVPSGCEGSATARGSEGESCVLVGGRQFRIRYSVELSNDRDGNAAAGSYVTIVATVEADRREIVLTRRVVAPTAGYTPGQSVVKTTVRSATGEPYVGPVYLLSQADTSVVRAGAQVGSDGVALLRASASQCSSTNPCVLGLRPSASDPNVSGQVGIGPTPTSVSGIVLTAGGLLEQTLTTFLVGTAEVQLLARGDNGTGVTPPAEAAGSICLWLNVADGAGRTSLPGCNVADAGRVVFDTYIPDGARSRFPIPVGIKMPLSVDSPENTCPSIPGHTGSIAAAPYWAPRAVCTSQTWGIPAEFAPIPGANTSFAAAEITITPGVQSSYQVVWAGAYARPATGTPGVTGPWSKPRQALGCADDTSCTPPAADYNPEDDTCPAATPHCLSAAIAAPALVSPASPHIVAVSAGGTTGFQLSGREADAGQSWRFRSLAAPSSGTLSCEGAAVSTGAVSSYRTSQNVTEIVANCSYTGDGTNNVSYWPIVGETASGRTARYNIALLPGGATNTQPFEVRLPSSTEVPQGAQRSVSVSVVGTNGKPSAGESVSFTSPNTALSFPSGSTVTTDNNGGATIQVAVASTTPRGSIALTARVASNGRSATSAIEVTPTLRAPLVLNTTGGAQGSTGSASIQASDGTGAPMAGVAVGFSVIDVAGRTPSGVFAEPAGCDTNASGACSVTIKIGKNAPAGKYVITAAAGGSTASSRDITVTQVPNQIRTTSTPIQQGGSANPVVTVIDGAGDPVPGQNVQFLSSGGINPTLGVVVSDAQGRATTTYNASNTANTTSAEVRVGTINGFIPFQVAGLPASITQVGFAPVEPGGSSSLLMSVQDAAGAPVKGATLSFVLDAGQNKGLQLGAQATSNGTGQVVVPISADFGTPPGAYSGKASYGTGAPVNITITVVS